MFVSTVLVKKKAGATNGTEVWMFSWVNQHLWCKLTWQQPAETLTQSLPYIWTQIVKKSIT